MSHADDLQRITRELWRLNFTAGMFTRRVGRDAASLGKIAKGAGCTIPQLESWLDGESLPSGAQMLAVMDNLPYPPIGAAPAALNGKRGVRAGAV
jgi:hypothetical protein